MQKLAKLFVEGVAGMFSRIEPRSRETEPKCIKSLSVSLNLAIVILNKFKPNNYAITVLVIAPFTHNKFCYTYIHKLFLVTHSGAFLQ